MSKGSRKYRSVLTQESARQLRIELGTLGHYPPITPNTTSDHEIDFSKRVLLKTIDRLTALDMTAVARVAEVLATDSKSIDIGFLARELDDLNWPWKTRTH